MYKYELVDINGVSTPFTREELKMDFNFDNEDIKLLHKLGHLQALGRGMVYATKYFDQLPSNKG